MMCFLFDSKCTKFDQSEYKLVQCEADCLTNFKKISFTCATKHSLPGTCTIGSSDFGTLTYFKQRSGDIIAYATRMLQFSSEMQLT
jgi:hypothetical protein